MDNNSNFKSPFTVENLYNRIANIDNVFKITFIFSIIIFVVIHGGFFSLRMVNEDVRHFLTGWDFFPANLPLGRLFGNIFTRSLYPWTIGFISSIYMSLASVTLVSLLKIKTNIGAIIASILLIGFPALAYLNGYFYSSITVTRSIFLTILAVWIADRFDDKKILKIGLSSIVFGFVLGSTQYELPVCMTLCVIVLFNYICDNENDIKGFLIKAFHFLLMGILSVALYMLVLKLTLYFMGVQLSSYKGMSQLGSLGDTLKLIKPSNILLAFKTFGSYFLGKRFFYLSIRQKVVYILFFIICFAKIARSFFKDGRTEILKNKWNYLFKVILIILLPICIDTFGIISPQAKTYTLTIYQMVFVFIFPIKYFENSFSKLFDGILHWGFFIIIGLTILYNYSTTTNFYLKAYTVNEWTMQFENRLLSRIEQYPGFRSNMPVAIISDGTISYNNINSKVMPTVINEAGFYSNYVGMTAYTTLKTVQLINNYTGSNLIRASDEQVNSIMLSEEYKTMGTFPAQNSIKIIDGIIVVNFMDYLISAEKIDDKTLDISIKTMNDSINTNISRTAWYVYVNGDIQKDLGRWYEPSTNLLLKTDGDGEYSLICFYDVNGIVKQKRFNFTLENGEIK